MSNNTKIFSEAIAEAKAIRETAMANAKLALEESFAPRMQEMMSNKLEALAEEEEMEEGYGQAEMDAVNDEISLEELLSELESLEEGEEEMEEGLKDMAKKVGDKVKATVGPDGKMDKWIDRTHAKMKKAGVASPYGANTQGLQEDTMDEAEEEDEVGTISVEELKDIIRDILSDVMGNEGEEEMEADEEEMEAGKDDLELEEILAEIASLEEGDDEMEEGVKDLAQKVGSKISKGFDKFYNAGQKVANKIAEPGSATKAIFREEELEEMDGGTIDPMNAFSGKVTGKELDIKLANAVKSAAKNARMSVGDFMKKHILAKPGEKSAPRETSWNESVELEEAMSTIATLRSELNEVNLLNAKLLYVNKLFKAKNLNESQKVKVINAFDRAETVREAKNVFDTLNESLNTEKAKSQIKSQIKESLSFASKAAGVSDRQPIMERNDYVARMQKLAGII
jgi:hypothetical protein